METEAKPLIVTIEDARRAAREASSYTRLETILGCYDDGLELDDTLRVLGEMWSICDNVGKYFEELDNLLPFWGAAPLLMTPEEAAALAALPARPTIYRGADRGINEAGLSWTRDRTVAERFPFMMRYLASNPVLVKGTVSKRRIIAVKLDRNEAEIIVHPYFVRVTATTTLTAPAAQAVSEAGH